MTFHSVNNNTCNPTFVDDDTASSRHDGGVNGDAGRSEDIGSAAWPLPSTPTTNSIHLSTFSILRNHHHHHVSPSLPEVACLFQRQSMSVDRQGENGSEIRLDSTVAVIDAALRIIMEDNDDEDVFFCSKHHHSHHDGNSMSDGPFQRQ